jgi:hypothetical protein
MSTALEIALMLAARLIAIVLGIAALVAARALEHEHREDRQ